MADWQCGYNTGVISPVTAAGFFCFLSLFADILPACVITPPLFSYSCGSNAEWSVLPVKGNIEERAVELAQYIIENRATVRAAAAKFGISKSTVHMLIY